MNLGLKRKKQLATITYHTFAIFLCFIMIYPLLWMFCSSLKLNEEIFATATSLIPTTFDAVHNYTQGFAGLSGVKFIVFIKNSFIVSCTATTCAMASSILASYAFARVNFKGSKFFFVCVMITMMIPNQVLIVPQYIIFKNLNFLNNRIALIVPWMFGCGFFIFLMLQFFRGLPVELDEAAEIDGCNKWNTLVRVLLPNITPAIVTSAIFCFYWTWQDFFQPLVFMSSPEKFTVSLGLRLYLDPESSSTYGSMLAMSTVSILPVLIMFMIFQKYLVEGVATSGLKG